ncbi:hypothetical protein GCM10020331_051790 [Ectobacillus funiculus]
MKKTLLIDMDSVICDLMSVWHERYNRDYQDNLTVDRLECWNSEKNMSSLNAEQKNI